MAFKGGKHKRRDALVIGRELDGLTAPFIHGVDLGKRHAQGKQVSV